MKRVLFLSGLLVLSLLATACGDHMDHGDSAGGGMDHGMHGGMNDSMNEGQVPGSPANATDSDREIKIVAEDPPAFEPSSLTVSAGEVVTFVVTNHGKVDHEFILGDAAYQEMHERDMMHGDAAMYMDNGVTVAPGETEKLTWEFDRAGEVLYGCHEPGHYEAGMVGTITVG